MKIPIANVAKFFAFLAVKKDFTAKDTAIHAKDAEKKRPNFYPFMV